MSDKQLCLFMSVKQFAVALGKSPASIRKWLKEGKIEGKKIGIEWLIPKTELKKLSDTKTVSGASKENNIAKTDAERTRTEREDK